MRSTSKTANSARPSDGNESTLALSAVNLKNTLWDTLQQIKNDEMLPAQGDAIAAQAREILRTVKVQLQIVGQSKRSVPMEVIDFAERA